MDSSVVVAALVEAEPAHHASLAALTDGRPVMWAHGLAECYATLTGGRLGFRVPPATAAELIRESVCPSVSVMDVPGDVLTGLFDRASAAGARGGAIYDFLHLQAAELAGSTELLTLNVRHFEAVAGANAPTIRHPAR